jgi:hypothetical protein
LTIGSRERKGIAAASVIVAIVRAVVVPDRVLRFRVAALASAVPIPATVAVPAGLDLRRGRIRSASDNAPPPIDRKMASCSAPPEAARRSYESREFHVVISCYGR